MTLTHLLEIDRKNWLQLLCSDAYFTTEQVGVVVAAAASGVATADFVVIVFFMVAAGCVGYGVEIVLG